VGENTAISWCDSTWNPWKGCTKKSAGCANCYAETLMDHRYRQVRWGPTGTRVRTSAAYWRQPIKWNAEAQAAGVRRLVFCASLADVFERSPNHPQLDLWRADLWQLVENTPALTWLLLTKRPENVLDMVPPSWHTGRYWPGNAWIGTSVENQNAADERIPALINIPAPVRFLSCEPLLGPVDLTGITCDSVWIDTVYAATDPGLGDLVQEEGWPIDWVIVGGESGPNFRPMHPDWARLLRDQCVAAGVPFFMKQMGGLRPGQVSDIPSDLMIQEFPRA
jgi:protein gp37